MVREIDRRDVLKGMGAAGAVALAGCTGGDDDDNTIQLGLLMGVTGALEQLGPPIRDGAQAATSQIADADNGWDVDTQFEDTATSPDTGTDGAQALVDAGYPMFVGALASDVSLPVARDVTLEEGVVQMSPASTAVEFSTLDSDIDQTLTWRTTPSDAFQGPVAAEIAANRIEASSVSTLALDDPYGRGLSEAFIDAFENEQGGTVEEDLLLDSSADSYTGQLETALAPEPDMLYVVAFPEQGQNLFRDFYEEFDQPDLPILVPDGLQDAALPADSGQDVETFSNVSGTGPGVSDDVASGLSAYQEQVSNDSIFVREAYDAAAVLSLAYAAADSDEPSDIQAEIRNVTSGGGEGVTAENLGDGVEMAGDGDDVEYSGVSRPLEFDDNGDVATPVYVYFDWTTEDGEPATNTIEVLTG